MEQIRTIYREVFSKSPAAIGADQKLTEEKWTDLVFAGSSYGQMQGFESGFQYAITLMVESLCN